MVPKIKIDKNDHLYLRKVLSDYGKKRREKERVRDLLNFGEKSKL